MSSLPEEPEDLPPPLRVEVQVDPKLAPITKQVNYHLDAYFATEGGDYRCGGIIRLSARGFRAVRVTDGGGLPDPTDALDLLEETWRRMMFQMQVQSTLQPWTCTLWEDEPKNGEFGFIYQWLRRS